MPSHWLEPPTVSLGERAVPQRVDAWERGGKEESPWWGRRQTENKEKQCSLGFFSQSCDYRTNLRETAVVEKQWERICSFPLSSSSPLDPSLCWAFFLYTRRLRRRPRLPLLLRGLSLSRESRGICFFLQQFPFSDNWRASISAFEVLPSVHQSISVRVNGTSWFSGTLPKHLSSSLTVVLLIPMCTYDLPRFLDTDAPLTRVWNETNVTRWLMIIST